MSNNITVTVKEEATKASPAPDNNNDNLIKCACGCSELIPRYDKRGRKRQYKQNHHKSKSKSKPSPELKLNPTPAEQATKKHAYLGYIEVEPSDLDEINGIIHSSCNICEKNYSQNLSDFEDYYIDVDVPYSTTSIKAVVCKSCYDKEQNKKKDNNQEGISTAITTTTQQSTAVS